jgi:hypothetical protein
MTRQFRRSVLGAVFALAIACPCAESADEPPRHAITVRVYDYTDVPDVMLRRAKEDVSRIFLQAGIDITWIDVPNTNPAAGFAVQIMIRRRPVDRPTNASDSVMGTSLGDTHDAGGSVFVFRDRVTHVAHERQQDVARVLGYAMAHEMGHLLLIYPAHSTNGLMRAEWDGDDLRHIAHGSMLFTPAQATLIRAKVASCCDAQPIRAK